MNDLLDLTRLAERLGEPQLAALIGVLTGAIFGVAAQRSAFCLRSATIEFARASLGPRMAIWLLCFSTALVWVQAARLSGLFDPQSARMMSVTGSWSGAIVGGLMFGAGMVLARGCSGRLVILASSGNLRSVMTGLIFAVFAQMSLQGWLAPARQYLAALWVTPNGRNIELASLLGLPEETGLVVGLLTAALALYLSFRHGIGPRKLVFAAGVGFSVAVGWVLTYALAQIAFEPVSVNSVTFSGPSAEALMFFLVPVGPLSFEVGLVIGACLGAAAAALLNGEFAWQGFEGAASMRRYMLGGALMGMGAMLAGGCAIGAGVTGSSILSGTAWLTLFFFFVGAGITDRLIDYRPQS